MASGKPVTNDPVLAAMEAKIAAWTKAAESYRAAVALDGTLGDVVPHAHHAKTLSGRPGGHELPVGVFRNKSLKDAIVLYLEACQKKQTNKEIAAGLQEGGIATTSKNFEPTVSTALYRLKEEGVLLRFPDGWDLAASYPDSLRRRLDNDRGSRATKPKASKRKAKPASKPALKALAAPTPQNDDLSKAG
jgi:hypothetical protein